MIMYMLVSKLGYTNVYLGQTNEGQMYWNVCNMDEALKNVYIYLKWQGFQTVKMEEGKIY